MAYRSPYRGEESLLSPRGREFVSRGTMLVVGVACAVLCVRGFVLLGRDASAATTQTARVSGWPFLMLTALGLLGGTLILASLLRVSAMQSLFEMLGSPPVTGDRSAGGANGWRHWFGGWWP